MTEEFRIMKIYNPFSDGFVFCTVHVDMQYSDKNVFIGSYLKSVMTIDDVDLVDYLNNEKLEEIEQKFIKEFDA